MRDEEQPLFDDYSRPSQQGDNRKSVIAILAVLALVLLAGLGVTTYMWRHTASELEEARNNNSGMTTMMPTPTPTAAPTHAPPAPPGPNGYPTEWIPIVQSVQETMDTSYDPCTNFWEFSCGGWLKDPKNKIPADRSRWSRAFGKLGENNEKISLDIAKSGWPLVDAFYQSCVNNKTADVSVLNDTLSIIQGVIDADSFTGALSELQLAGVSHLFEFGSGADQKQPERILPQYVQGGLSLPQSYYGDATKKAQLDAVATFAATLIALLPGFDQVDAKTMGQQIVELEAMLAATSMTNVEERDPYAVYNRVPLATLQNMTESINFALFANQLQLPANYDANGTNVATPKFFQGLDAVLLPLFGNAQHLPKTTTSTTTATTTATPMPTTTGNTTQPTTTTTAPGNTTVPTTTAPSGGNTTVTQPANTTATHLFTTRAAAAAAANSSVPGVLQSYLAFKLAVGNANLLGPKFQQAVFDLEKALSGTTELPPRDVQCVRALNGDGLGFDVGHVFVTQVFSKQIKEAVTAMLDDVIHAFELRMHNITWLDADALKNAELKLHKITKFVGYPETWPQHNGVTLSPDDYYRNVQTLRRESVRMDIAKLGKPTVDEWQMTPQTVNAYYDPSHNSITLPAGILRGTFYNRDAPGALNYGGIGGVLGHELHHSTDDQGSQYDASGALHPIFDKKVQEAFKNRTACVVKTYEAFDVPAPGNKNLTLHVNGHLTLGENLADMGGIAGAYRAYTERLMNDTAFAQSEARITKAFNGTLNNKQLYFVAWAQNWCMHQTLSALESQLASDPHSPGYIRVLGPVSQTPQFAEVFQCKNTTLYNPVDRCVVW